MDYLAGSDVLGADWIGDMGTGGAPSLPLDPAMAPMDTGPSIGKAAAEAAVATLLKKAPGAVQARPEPWHERKAIGNIKVWQVGLGAGGLVSILVGITLAVRR